MYGAITRCGRTFQTVPLPNMLSLSRLFRFRSPLLSESRLISFPPGTEMFQFSGFASPGLCIQPGMTLAGGFPHSEICGSKLVCQLPAAYRKLLRPSSPVIAKASTICTYSLDPITLKPLIPGFGKNRDTKDSYRNNSRLCQSSHTNRVPVLLGPQEC